MLRFIQIIIEMQMGMANAFFFWLPYGPLVGTAVMMTVTGIYLGKFISPYLRFVQRAYMQALSILDKKPKVRHFNNKSRVKLGGDSAKRLTYCGERRHPEYTSIIVPYKGGKKCLK